MLTEDLDNLSLRELIDALAQSTTELLALMNIKGADGNLMFDKMQEVQKIQEAINRKKAADHQES